MKRKTLLYMLLSLSVLAAAAPSLAQDLQPITLPQPQKAGGKPLMQALAERKTTRAFSEQRLSPQLLSISCGLLSA